MIYDFIGDVVLLYRHGIRRPKYTLVSSRAVGTFDRSNDIVIIAGSGITSNSYRRHDSFVASRRVVGVNPH